MTVFAVVVLYQAVRSYWWPGVTFGAQDGFSSIRALRSPLLIAPTVTCMALVPPCGAAWVTSKVCVLSPQPDRSQQTGKPSAASTSRPGLLSRLAPAKERPGTASTSSRVRTTTWAVRIRSRRLKSGRAGRFTRSPRRRSWAGPGR
nr:hypothetical protein GCM10020092_060830 [Actinoplanes digitatis]